MTVNEHISKAKSQIEKIVRKCKTDSRTIIARYTAAVAVNFTDWIGKTIPWVRHEISYHTLVDNLRCESANDHVGMLLRFAKLCNALPESDDFAQTYEEVSAIRHLFAEPATAGLAGVVLCAVLENVSEIFIPDLAGRAKSCGCTNFEYTDVHGEADIKHSKAFIDAVEAELTMGYREPIFVTARPQYPEFHIVRSPSARCNS